MKYISKTVGVLSLVSLFTDIASEMLYPILPIYLKSIGYSILFIGILEGITEVVAGYGKGYFGQLSDDTGKRVPFVRLGYALSAIAKPLLSIGQVPFVVLFSRILDRIGKGVRTGARDAILSSEATNKTKARVFGFHRSMDTLGAVLGPSFALVYLYFYPKDYIFLFYLAFLPGIIAIGFTFFLKEKLAQSKQTSLNNQKSNKFISLINYWKTASPNYKKLVVGLLVFAFWNSSDVFLILRSKEAGLNDYQVIGIYIFYNLVYAVFSYPLGVFADKIGLKKMLLCGLGIYAGVYFLMGLVQNPVLILLAFFLYGVYAAATEGISKAWISNVTPSNETATAIGLYAGMQSISAFFASLVAGWLWFLFGAPVTFIVTGVVAVFVILYFLKVKITEETEV
ncbi:MFS transporter [Leptospira sp. 2 VSF19]|uniref:MFS transporter n=1 Tax=Leptospira soteropolitanensis TaxID=2950025 RepID=A0AAW5VNV4_9LEPT|nr:MFS transporter [Leptospira soteropolitanensis]MCW7493710.1 MFS transporter [Leptospira soteropolitanensis]MCW7501308.1 MFS transporter [Leptospira soteropolitanensis]MCW7523506.1 MFS transporter [Leptospira soteropolitanensis]MCW7527422.1 MFS transporter [Leptospira soteropolitanensis]MCW7531278.1 MFS transporter [Leptospira soteropolitanensis]